MGKPLMHLYKRHLLNDSQWVWTECAETRHHRFTTSNRKLVTCMKCLNPKEKKPK